MDFRTYVTALRRHWWIPLLTTMLALFGSALAFWATPPTYASTVAFYVSTPISDGTNAQSAGQFAQARVNSYVVLMSSERVAEAVVERTGVDLAPTEVMRKVTAEASLNTVVVRATVRDSSPERVALLAEGLADTFGTTVSKLDNPGTGRATVIINVVSGPTALGPVAPQLKVYFGLGLLVGLILGVLLVLLREILDNTLRTADAAASLVGAPVLGNIRFDADARKSPLISRDRTGSLRAESFRQLRTNLQFVNAAHSTKVLVMTSATSGEGKTSSTVNLALALAEAGQRVLIVEGDLRRPAVAGLLGLESELGLTNVLVGQVPIADALQEWAPRITVLTSGSMPPNPSELLGGQKMSELLSTLRPRFDQILIDTPPLLPVTDAAVVAGSADGVVMVVRSAKTTRDQVAAATRALRVVNAELVGVVFNMRRPRRHESRGYGPRATSGWQLDPDKGPEVADREHDPVLHAAPSGQQPVAHRDLERR